MKHTKSLSFKSYLFYFLGIALLLGCQTENEIIETIQTSSNEEFKNYFNPESLKKALPYDFEIKWNNSERQYSEDLESFYYEFPIIYTSKFNPDEINKIKSQKSGYKISYKLFITEDENQEHKYYILKFYEKITGASSNSIKKFNWSSGFTGFVHLLNENGKIIYDKKIENDIIDDKKLYKEEFKNSRKENEGIFNRVDESCKTTTTYHYTDWYNKDQNGNLYFLHTRYDGFTTEESCETFWLPDLVTQGGGGSGAYTNTGDAGVYNDCTGAECKYLIDDEIEAPCAEGYVRNNNGVCVEEKFSVENLTDDCAKKVIIEEILGNINAGVNAGLINSIRNLFNNDDNVTLVFNSSDNVPDNANAATGFDTDSKINSGSYGIFIGFSNDYLNSNPTKLSLALTTIHETVHAKLIYSYLHGNLLQDYPNYGNLKDKMDNFVANRNITNGEALNDAMHIAMVDFIGTMSYSLFKYAEHTGMDNVTEQYCKDITKGSFYNTPAMDLIDTGNSTPKELNNKLVNEQNNTLDAKGDSC